MRARANPSAPPPPPPKPPPTLLGLFSSGQVLQTSAVAPKAELAGGGGGRWNGRARVEGLAGGEPCRSGKSKGSPQPRPPKETGSKNPCPSPRARTPSVPMTTGCYFWARSWLAPCPSPGVWDGDLVYPTGGSVCWAPRVLPLLDHSC